MFSLGHVFNYLIFTVLILHKECFQYYCPKNYMESQQLHLFMYPLALLFLLYFYKFHKFSCTEEKVRCAVEDTTSLQNSLFRSFALVMVMCSSVRECFGSKPPMAVFSMSIVGFALTLVGVSLYFQSHRTQILNPDIKVRCLDI